MSDAAPARKIKDSAVVFAGRFLAASGGQVAVGPEASLEVKWLRAGLFADFGAADSSRTTVWTAGGGAGFGVPLSERVTWELGGFVASRRYNWTPAPGGGLLDLRLFTCEPSSQSSGTAVFGLQSGFTARLGHFFISGMAFYDRDITPVRLSYSAKTCQAGFFSDGGSYPAAAIAPSPDHLGLLARVGGFIGF
jgi:hypothetical protein